MIVRAATLMLALGLAIQVSANSQQPADVRAPQQVQPMPGDNRLVQYVFDANDTFTVMTRPQSATHIQLAPDESLQHVVLGDTVQWIVAKLSSHLFVKPLKPDIFTSATILTDKRVYQLTFRAGPLNGPWFQRVSWAYPGDEMLQTIDAEKQRTAAAAAKAEAKEAGASSPSPENLNWGYSIAGEASFRPVAVFDDGKSTYLRFASSQAQHPAIFLRDADGTLTLVNYSTRGDLVVLHRIARELLLKIGPVEVRVLRDGETSSAPSAPSSVLRWLGITR